MNWLTQRILKWYSSDGSSRPDVFCKKRVLRNSTKFTGKHLCHSLFFNKIADLGPAILFKKRLWHRCFPVNFVKFLRTPFYTEHLWWLLLQWTELKCKTDFQQIQFSCWHSFKYYSCMQFVEVLDIRHNLSAQNQSHLNI